MEQGADTAAAESTAAESLLTLLDQQSEDDIPPAPHTSTPEDDTAQEGRQQSEDDIPPAPRTSTPEDDTAQEGRQQSEDDIPPAPRTLAISPDTRRETRSSGNKQKLQALGAAAEHAMDTGVKVAAGADGEMSDLDDTRETWCR